MEIRREEMRCDVMRIDGVSKRKDGDKKRRNEM